jgi:hypothetical protein
LPDQKEPAEVSSNERPKEPGAQFTERSDLSSIQGAAESLLNRGEPLAAYDTLAAGLRRFPADVRLRQLQALALARTGAGRLAVEVLEGLVHEGHADEETLGMLARTYKDRWG